MAQRDWNPTWWKNEDTSMWDRVKEALKRDWEQTKNDFSSKAGKDLDQDVDDTIRQAAGKQPIPGPNTPNPPDTSKHTSTAAPSTGSKPLAVRTIRDDDWARSEEAMRFGYGAAGHYQNREWDNRLEDDLKKEWGTSQDHASWDDVKETIRHGWTGRRSSETNKR